MAKQASLHKINGKADGRSYYYSQNGGYLSRQINPGMSQRVKTAPEFANTRRNGKEFGSMGMLAGGIVRMLTQRWRFILDPITTGKLGKELYAQLRATAGTWGQRELATANFGNVFPLLNKYSKNQLPSGLAEAFASAKFEQVGTQVGGIQVNRDHGLTISGDWGEELVAKGASGASFILVALDTNVPEYSDNGDNYILPDTPKLQVLDTIVEDLGQGSNFFDDSYTTGWPTLATGLPRPLAIGIICLPFKAIGSQKYVLQELCSFACVTPTYAAS